MVVITVVEAGEVQVAPVGAECLHVHIQTTPITCDRRFVDCAVPRWNRYRVLRADELIPYLNE